ncbi:MAG: TIGR03790 family protein [Bryobacteraceae bacterium]|nr:TIGR03790 family protein [Bryobacteraceae bacterium]
MKLTAALGLFLAASGWGLTREQVALIVNEASADSRAIAESYARARSIPHARICRIRTAPIEEIARAVYDREIAAPVRDWLHRHGLREEILCLVTTSGVPLKIRGTLGRQGTAASVDSELATLYEQRHGAAVNLEGPRPNPYYRASEPFSHPRFPMYLVTRLTGYTVEDVRAMITRSLKARNSGVVALDQRGPNLDQGNFWLLEAAGRLPAGRVRLEDSSKVLSGLRNVIGYASWGSNDGNRKHRDPGFHWLPGGIATQFVSTDGRTFREPPAAWRYTNWADRANHWAGSPQSLTGDLIRQGATGASGHVYEPMLQYAPRPQVLFPAYIVEGRTLAESFWASIPALSWMNIVVGDPLCRLAPAPNAGASPSDR